MMHVEHGARAADLAASIERVQSEDAVAIALQCRELEAEFARWAVDAPDEERRAKTVAALDELTRRARELLSE